MPPVTTVTVSQAESGQKLLQFLERRIALSGADTVPRSAIQRWIRKGHVRVDGGRKKPFDRIHAGQKVRIPPHGTPDAPPESTPPPPSAPLDIVHEDTELLLIAKPAGLPVHGGTGHHDSVAARLAIQYAGAAFRPTLVHRLDKNTSGLLLAAKTYDTLRRLNELVASGNVEKHYLAWTTGTWPHHEPVLLEDTLQKEGTAGAEKVTTGAGKVARCRVTPLRTGARSSLLRVQLLTGRTHQIRVQLASRGHAIVGDGKYGCPARTGMLLHAYSLAFEGQNFALLPNWPAPFDISEQLLLSSSM